MSDSSLMIRPARLSDRAGIWPLVEDFATSFAPTPAAFEVSFAHLVQAPDTLLLVADSPRWGIAGYLLANVHLTLFADGPVAWVEEVMVTRRLRRGGIGRQLVTHAEHWATRRGAGYIGLATRRADDFYQALRYERSATFYRKRLP